MNSLHLVYGHFLSNFRDPAQNLGVMGDWTPVSLNCPGQCGAVF